MEDGFRERLQRALDARAFAEVAPLLDAAELEVCCGCCCVCAACCVFGMPSPCVRLCQGAVQQQGKGVGQSLRPALLRSHPSDALPLLRDAAPAPTTHHNTPRCDQSSDPDVLAAEDWPAALHLLGHIHNDSL